MLYSDFLTHRNSSLYLRYDRWKTAKVFSIRTALISQFDTVCAWNAFQCFLMIKYSTTKTQIKRTFQLHSHLELMTHSQSHTHRAQNILDNFKHIAFAFDTFVSLFVTIGWMYSTSKWSQLNVPLEVTIKRTYLAIWINHSRSLNARREVSVKQIWIFRTYFEQI